MLTVSDLVAYHYEDDKSDQIWGYYKVEQTNRGGESSIFYYRFWGRRSAKTYSESAVDAIGPLQNVEDNKIEDGYNKVLVGSDLYRDIKAKLPEFSQMVIKSQVTSIEIREKDSIKPSQVYQTVEAKGSVDFFNQKGIFLGSREIQLKNKIYNHLRKTKEVSDVYREDDNKIIIWVDK